MRRAGQVRHFRRLPLQQVTPADPQPIAGANDRIQCEICLMRQESGHDDRAIQIAAGFVQGANIASPSLRQSLEAFERKAEPEERGRPERWRRLGAALKIQLKIRKHE